MKTHVAIIVAGGTGTRMGSGLPKQFLSLLGKPVLGHTLEAFRGCDDIVVVMHPDFIETWEKMVFDLEGLPSHQVVAGGETRYHSVLNGLHAMKINEGIVSIHDAARPLVSAKLVRLAYDTALVSGSAVPVIPVEDTVREITDDGSRIIAREKLFRVQTPQSFDLALIRKAYQQPYLPHFTDDAALIENMGMKVHFFPGDKRNLKVTVPEDLVQAEQWLRFPAKDAHHG